jgi:phosphoglycerol transferase MdoB-like AlkP superfamily enzyme
MGPLDALWHLFNFFVPALGVGALAALGAKLAWRRELAAVSWRRLFLWPFGASAIVLVAGLIVFGRDGKMATYGGVIVASAAALWWAGFGPGRR